MVKSKYTVYTDCVVVESNSRNARKHLEATGAQVVIVCKNDGITEVSRAYRLTNGIILVGARRV